MGYKKEISLTKCYYTLSSVRKLLHTNKTVVKDWEECYELSQIAQRCQFPLKKGEFLKVSTRKSSPQDWSLGPWRFITLCQGEPGFYLKCLFHFLNHFWKRKVVYGWDFCLAHFCNAKQETTLISRSLRQSHVFLFLKCWFTLVQDRACYSLWRTIKSQKHSLLTGNNWHHYVINKSTSYAHSPPPPFFCCSHLI